MKVGDYVRTKDGDIGKIKENDGELIKYCVGTLYGIDLDRNCLDREVLKSSPNIIDLIEEGDILKVNDFKDVYTIYEVEMLRNPYTNEKYLGIRNDIGKRPKRLYEIPLVNLSIVTHEQFSQMKYKVGEQ
jgi:hypothetical protein